MIAAGSGRLPEAGVHIKMLMSYNILIVDDSAIMRHMVARALRLSGLPLGELYHADDGRAGVAVARQHRLHLIVTDLNMPVMDGDEMIDELRADPCTAGLPVIVMSSEASEVRRQRLAAYNIPFVQKPFARELLSDIIRRTLQA